MDASDLMHTVRRRRLPDPAVRRALRIGAGVSQQELADVLGIDRASVCRYELGTRSPRGDLAARYAGLLRRLAREAAS